MSMRGTPHLTFFLAFSLFASGECLDHDSGKLSRKAVPEIGGSQGGFIGLVIALSVLILVCCAAVFFLLRNHEPSEQGRAARRERYRRSREHNATAATPETSSFGGKLRGIWAKAPGGRSESRGGGRRGGRGWIRAGSGDEWESHSDHDEERSAQPMKPFPRPFEGAYQETDSPLSDVTSGTYAQIPYTSSYVPEPSHRASPQQVSFVRSQSPLPILPGSHHQETNTDEDDVPPPDHRHFSTQSSTSVRSFEGGTKFIESF